MDVKAVVAVLLAFAAGYGVAVQPWRGPWGPPVGSPVAPAPPPAVAGQAVSAAAPAALAEERWGPGAPGGGPGEWREPAWQAALWPATPVRDGPPWPAAAPDEPAWKDVGGAFWWGPEESSDGPPPPAAEPWPVYPGPLPASPAFGSPPVPGPALSPAAWWDPVPGTAPDGRTGHGLGVPSPPALPGAPATKGGPDGEPAAATVTWALDPWAAGPSAARVSPAGVGSEADAASAGDPLEAARGAQAPGEPDSPARAAHGGGAGGGAPVETDRTPAATRLAGSAAAGSGSQDDGSEDDEVPAFAPEPGFEGWGPSGSGAGGS